MPATASSRSAGPWLEEAQSLFEKHHRMILQTAYRITGNRMDAEDVLQTVFTRLLKRRRFPGGSRSTSQYFRVAAINAALDVVRSPQVRRSLPLDSIHEQQSEDQGPGQVLEAQRIRAWLREGISRLSPRSAEIFVLRFLQGFKNQEIAEILGTSDGVVAVTLHRARTQLKAEIRKKLGGRNE